MQRGQAHLASWVDNSPLTAIAIQFRRPLAIIRPNPLDPLTAPPTRWRTARPRENDSAPYDWNASDTSTYTAIDVEPRPLQRQAHRLALPNDCAPAPCGPHDHCQPLDSRPPRTHNLPIVFEEKVARIRRLASKLGIRLIFCALPLAHQRRTSSVRHATTQALGSPSRPSFRFFRPIRLPRPFNIDTIRHRRVYPGLQVLRQPCAGSFPDDGSRKWSCRQLPAGFRSFWPGPRLHDAVPPFPRVAYPHKPRYDLARG